MLEIKNIHVAYGNNKILQGVNLSFEKGKIHGILGVNGAGKTTLFKTIYGFKKSATGSILYQGQPLTNQDIGFLETSCYFYPLMTGMEYLELLGKGNEKFSMSKWNELFELPLHEYVENYSTGMKKS